MRYADAIHCLYDLRLFGLKLGLENTRWLAGLAGQPHERLRFLHVAGTNGKGSTCAMLESICRAAGLRVGLFTSPHLVSFRERIQVDRQLIAEAEVVRWVEWLQAHTRARPADAHPTFFEAVTVMALGHFAEHQCDVVVWETGMGGRLDATNIVTPLVSVITNIHFDHQQWLGYTLPEIAREKAGIIKPGIPAVTATDAPEALAVLRSTAAACGAPFHAITRADTVRPPLDRVTLPLLGAHQRVNAALAVAALRAVAGPLPIRDAELVRGLEQVRWPGRLQVLETGPGRRTLLDGAHNPGGAAVLRAALEESFGGTPPHLILGLLRDKDTDEVARLLAPGAASVHLVPVASDRSASAAELMAACRHHAPNVPAHACASLADALERTAAVPLRVVTGSLYLVGQALEALGGGAVPARDERGLNEYGLAPTPAPDPSGAPPPASAR